MFSRDVYVDASEKFHHVDEITSVIRDSVMESLNRLDAELASDTLYNYINDAGKRRLEAVRSQLLYTSVVDRFFKTNGGDEHLHKLTSTPNGLQFIECVKKLTNYAITLLRPVNMRPETWDSIMTSNVLLNEIISPFEGYDLILNEIGYRLRGGTFIYQKKAAVSLERVREVSSDLLVFRAYMEVKMGVEKAPDNVVMMPVRTEVKRPVAIKPDAPQLCDMCSQPAKFMCLEDVKACTGKAWCPPCNTKWHVQNEARRTHRLETLKSSIPDPSQLTPPSRKSPNHQQPSTTDRRISRPSSASTDPALPALKSSMPLYQAPSPLRSAPPPAESALYQSPTTASPNSVPEHYYDALHPVMVYTDPPLRPADDGHLPPLPPSPYLVAPGVIPPGYMAYNPPYMTPPSTPLQKPIPAPRRSVRRSVDSVERPLGANTPSVASTPMVRSSPQVPASRGPAADELVVKLKMVVDQVLANGSIQEIRNKMGAFQQSMNGIKARIDRERSGSAKKATLSQELMQVRSQCSRLETRLDELEAEIKQSHLNMANHFDHVPVTPVNQEQENVSVPLDSNYGMTEELSRQATLTKHDEGPTPLVYLKPIEAAENAGYSMDEILIGLKQVPVSEINDWLSESYPTIQFAVKLAAEENPNIPKFCAAEIKQAVVSHGLNCPSDITDLNSEAMINTCLTARKETVTMYVDLFNDLGEADEHFKIPQIVTRKLVNDLIYECNADSEEILWQLNEKVAEVIRKYIWEPFAPEELDTLDGLQVPKRALAILQDDATDMSIKLMVARAELGLSQKQTDQIGFLMRNLHDKDGRTFEFKDAIIAVKSVDKTRAFHENTVAYLSNPCLCCCAQFSKHMMANLFCHDTTEENMGLCIECAKDAFTIAIRTEPVAQFVCPARCGAPASHITPDTNEAYPFFEKLLSVVFPNIGLSRELEDKFNNKVAIWRMSTDKNLWAKDLKVA